MDAWNITFNIFYLAYVIFLGTRVKDHFISQNALPVFSLNYNLIFRILI